MNKSNPKDDPRIRLAAERTLLAWQRTSLAFMGFGFVVARFGLFLEALTRTDGVERVNSLQFSHWLGVSLVALGAAASILSGIEHVMFLRRYRNQSGFQVSPVSLSAVFSVLLAIVGIVIVVYLFHAR